jgi:hypothetical protein
MKLRRTQLPSGFDEAGGTILTDSNFVAFIKAITQPSGTPFKAPSFIVMTGQQSKIEIVNRINSTKAWTGLVQSAEATLFGELIRVQGLVDLGFLNGMDQLEILKALDLVNSDPSKPGDKPLHFQTEYEVWLPDRSTGLFVVDSPQPEGFVTLVCVTATLIDP